MSNNMQEFGFGDGDEKVGAKSKRFKAKEGEKYRVSFVWWPEVDGKPNMDAPTPKFIGCKRLYLQGVGYFIDKGAEFTKLAGAQSKMYAATLICLWPVDQNGELDKGRFQSGEFHVVPWVMSIDKYRTIEQNHNEFPLGTHDLKLTCTDTTYQKLTMSPARENLLRRLYESEKPATKEIVAAILAATKEGISEIGGELAQDLTIEEIRERLGRQAGGAGGHGPGPGSAVTQSDNKQFDSMLDDILG
jgi:hypothetical protein